MTLEQFENLEESLSYIVSILANFFHTTEEIIILNAPYYLSQLGWYITFKNFYTNLFKGFVIMGLGIIILFLFLIIHTSSLEEIINFLANHSLSVFIVFMILLTLPVWSSVILCIISPEMVGIEYLFPLIKIS